MSYLMCRSPSATVIDLNVFLLYMAQIIRSAFTHRIPMVMNKYLFFFNNDYLAIWRYLRVSEKKTLFLELLKLMKYMNIFK